MLIVLSIGLLTVTLFFSVYSMSRFGFFSSDSFFFSFAARNTISTAIVRKIFLYRVYTNLAYVTPMYRRVKKLQVIMINKDVRKSLARKKGNDILIWSWNGSPLTGANLGRYHHKTVVILRYIIRLPKSTQHGWKTPGLLSHLKLQSKI